MPFELFIDEANRSPGGFRQMLPTFDDRTDPRMGPRVWHWDAGSIVRPLVWLPESLANSSQTSNAWLTTPGWESAIPTIPLALA